MSVIESIDPRTGVVAGGVEETSSDRLEQGLAAAAAAAPVLAALPVAHRVALLAAVADQLDAHADELVELADRETGLGPTRLTGELARTTTQLRFLGQVIADGGPLGVTIDTPDPAAVPPRPDLRRTAVPIGVVLVFAASNFPFAFSVAGGDTAGALAAGCPVLLKAHPLHPRLSERTGELVAGALESAGAPAGAFAVLHGVEAGPAALRDPRVKAAAFTGSVPGGRALFDIASSRPEPIPFYGELGSINPVLVTRAAALARGDEIARGLVGSFTLGTGQFCTKPGLVLVPADTGFEDRVRPLVAAAPAGVMLAPRLREAFRRERDSLTGVAAVAVLARGAQAEASGAWETPLLLVTGAADLIADPGLAHECFGPSTLLVRYAPDELDAALAVLPGSLTATLHAEPDEDGVADLMAALAARAGRVLWGGWPTGVAVSWAQHHGGPYPSTTAPLHTSVGAASLTRFLRPVSFQGAPDAVLPPELRDRNELGIMRRVDGVLTRDDVAPAP